MYAVYRFSPAAVTGLSASTGWSIMPSVTSATVSAALTLPATASSPFGRSLMVFWIASSSFFTSASSASYWSWRSA